MAKKSILTKADTDFLLDVFKTVFPTKNEFKRLEREFKRLEKAIDKKLEERLKNIPTKHEFFNAMDKLMKELKAMREEHQIAVPRIYDHEERISSLEEIHPSGQHATV